MAAFFVGPTRVFAWVGTSTTWTVREIPDRDQLLDLVNGVQADMRTPDTRIDWPAAQDLSRMLLDPVEADWAADQPLFVVAPGILEGLPWPALPLDDDRQRSGHSPSTAAPSSTSRHWAGPDVAAAKDLAHGRTALLVVGYDAPASPAGLRFAEDEARAIAAAWPAEAAIAVGDDARWSHLVRQDLGRFGAIHVASHAVVTEAAGGAPVLRLAGAEDEVLITTEEIGRLHLSADLVYLSCCEGSRIRWDRGTGLDSFARAFLQAGARSVIASSCVVDDAAARSLALAYYAARATGDQPIAALRRARLQIRDEGDQWSHPFYWAFYQQHRVRLGSR